VENRPRPFMKSHQSNKTTEQHQQPPVEEQSTKRDSSNFQATIIQVQSLDEVMKLIPYIPSPKEEPPKLIPVCNQDEFFVEPKKIKQNLVLEEVSPTAEIPKEVDKSLEESKEVVRDKF